ncbi:MAG TPA: M1 family metallopeptidase [Bryobacteraceae bacterium]|nr:M1 family metallopeptidase [Bryobacteraceae bacterium]
MKLLCVALVTCLGTLAADAPPKLRLSEVEDVQPVRYKAELNLDTAKDTFTGTITIQLQIEKPVQTLWLNQKKLSLSNAALTARGRTQKAKAIAGGDEFVGLVFDAPLVPGPAELKIDYSGKYVLDGTSGLFREEDSGSRYLFTQFETTDARAAFPCFDEPSYKTPWQLTLHIPAANSAVSNTPIASETTRDGLKTVVFRETKPLPSYLVALAVGPFEFVDGGKAGQNHVPVRIVVPKGKAAQAKYAAEVTATILTRLEDYFGIPYPYEKSDQVAVGNLLGAMENAGMVTYDDRYLLGDPAHDRIARQRNYVAVAAHELAHQWFGDLVTTSWWDDIWLNEAFAEWMMRKLVAEWKPEWETRAADISDIMRAETNDSLASARMIRQPIESKNDIANAFDDITYEKGASIIAMFEAWMGPGEFRKGVQTYLRQNAFKTGTSGKFLDALSSASGRNVGAAFSTFLNQAGLPMVSVSLDCKGSRPVLKTSQERMSSAPSKGQQKWSIPLCVRFGSGNGEKNQCSLLTQASQDVELTEASGCPSWVQANDGAHGYYAVDYKGGLLNSLLAGDVQKRLSPAERAELVGSAQILSQSGKLPAADVLSLVEGLHDDPEHSVVETELLLATDIRDRLTPANLIPNFERFLRKNFSARARALGWTSRPNDNDGTRLLRAQLLPVIATLGGDSELAGQAKELAEKWFADHNAVEPDMLPAVLRTAAYYGDKQVSDRMLAELAKTKDKQTRERLIEAMRRFRDPDALRGDMEAAFDGRIPTIEGMRLLFVGQHDERARHVSLDFLKSNWPRVEAAMPSVMGSDYGSALPHVGQAYCDIASRDSLASFLGPKMSKYEGGPRTLDQVVETINVCIANKAAQGPGLAEFLSRY